MIKWFATCLKNRSQFTTVGKDELEYQYINGGVPHGSKVGASAFIIKKNQLPSVIRDETSLFLTPSNESYVVIEDETMMLMDDTKMFEVLDVTGHGNRRPFLFYLTVCFLKNDVLISISFRLYILQRQKFIHNGKYMQLLPVH